MTTRAEVDDTTYKWKAFGAVGLFFLTSVLAFAMVFLTLPAIADDFGVTLRDASWVVIAYTLTITALLLPMGRLADLIGRRRIHLLGLIVFAIGTLLVAVAPSFQALIAARVVMGVGDAMAQSVATGILVSVFPKRERGKAIGSQTTAVAVGAAVGPIFTGLVLQVLPWRALFALLLVLVVVAFIAGVIFLDEEKLSTVTHQRQPFDWLGAALSVPAVVLLVVVINNPLDLAWSSLLMLVLIVVIVVLFTAFIRWELRSAAPMFDLRFFKIRVFALGVAARFVGFMAATTIYFLMPIFVISFRQMSEGRAGTVLFLNSVGLGVMAQI
ncbi:MAG: MFS transporter, partial [Actinomycetia bacterium]|nr:MFS transporter [Actinomycetes bacterium]